MTTVTANGRSYSDDGTTPRDVQNGGHRIHLLPMLSDVLVEVANAKVYRDAAAASAATASAVGSAFACTASAPANMSVKVGAGSVFDGIALTQRTQQASSIIVKPVANPRIDRIVGDDLTGLISVIAGIEAAAPVAPAIPAGKFPIARIALTTATASIIDTMITDERAQQPAAIMPTGGAMSGALTVQPATVAAHPVTAGQLHAQSLTAFTTAGAAPALTLAPSPPLTAYAAWQRFSVKFHAAGGDTINVNGLGAKSLRQYDSTGAKIPAVTAAGQLADVEYDGVDWVILDPLPAAVPVQVGLQGSFKNLSASADGVSSTVNAWMDECIVKDSGGVPRLLSNLALSVNLATAGANGLDTGVVAANGWYSLWVIYNPTTQMAAGIAALCPLLTGNTTSGSAVVTGLASTASMRVGMPVAGSNIPAGSVIKSVDSGSQITLTNKALTTVAGASLTFVYDPVMPAGYTMRARCGMARTDGTANKYPLSFVQSGRRVQFKVAAGSNVVAMPALAIGAQGSVSAPTWVAVSTVNVLPPTATRIALVGSGLGGSQMTLMAAPSSSHGSYSSTTNPPPMYTNQPAGITLPNIFGDLIMESANVYIASSGGGFFCFGWEDNL